MRVYIRPTARIVPVRPVLMVGSKEEEEVVEFTFRTETGSIWDNDLVLE